MNDEPVKIKFSFTLPHPLTVFGISVYGVQPLFFVRHLLHIPDRNVLSRICAPQKTDADAYWISQLNSPDITINPIFTAAESNKQRAPTREEFVTQYLLAEKAIRERLPLISFTPHTKETISASYAIIQELADRRSRETAFLIETAPLVAHRVPDSGLLKAEELIFASAAKHGLTNGSLSLLAILSCLYENSQGLPTAPGRGVLKPKSNYTAQLAHNGMSDLLAIELLIATSSLGIGQNAFITADRSLGRFWQAISATPTAPVDGKGTGTFNISTDLLHRIDAAGLARIAEFFSN